MKKTTLATIITLLLSGGVYAEDANSTSENNEQAVNDDTELFIITGTSRPRLETETPQSVTAIRETEIAKFAMSSQADILRSVPGVKVEGGGGEVATNLQVRGLPSSGQFQFTPLLFDSSPTLSVFGLNSSAYDVYFRGDLGIKRVEFVRGGVSNLFGQGSVAGVINYVSKTGSEKAEGSMQLEVSDHNRKRFDFAASGPLSDKNLFYAVSGYYRYDEGPLNTGLPTQGMQLRGNIKKEFDDGSGYFTVYGQTINDRVQFFLPFPLDGESRKRISGNDGKIVESVQTARASSLSYNGADGSYESPISDGVVTKGSSVSFEFNRSLNDEYSILARAKYSNYKHEFNLFLDGDGLINVPETQSEYLTNASAQRMLSDLTNPMFTYADSGLQVPAGDLLFANRILDRKRPATDFSSEINLIRDFETTNFYHSLTVGGFFSKTEADDDNVITRYLAEFNNVPRLINLSGTDSNGNNIIVSKNGITDLAIGYSNKTLTAQRNAVYIADQMEGDDWIIDVGMRWESIKGTINQEGSVNVNVDDNPELHPNLQTSVTGNGATTYAEVEADDFAIAAAALYKLSDNFNIYANASRGFFFPEIRGVGFNPDTGEPNSYESEIIIQAEIGAKFFLDDFSGSIALFKTDLDDRRSVDFVNDANGNAVEVPVFQSTTAHGVEYIGTYDFSDELHLDTSITYTDHKFSEFESDPTVVGNELRRKPKLLFNAALRYTNDTWDGSLYYNYNGKNFTNDANTVELDDFHLFNLDVGYTWKFTQDDKVRASIGVFNLLDSEGITEGSPRQGNSQSAESAYFVGRPILPRRLTARVRYDF